MNIAAIILAAGLSSRMGGFKPLLRLGESSLLAHCRTLFRTVGLSEIFTVVGHRAGETAAEAESLNMRWVRNTDYRSGMFSSIQCGVAALSKDIDAFFVLPVDIPLIRPATLRAILTAFSNDGDAVISPVFAGRRGHPPLITANVIPWILNYDGDGGLAALLRRSKGIDFAVWDEGIHLDADVTEDFETLRQRFHRLSIPSPDETLALAELTMDAEAIEHGRLVAKVALVLAQALQDRGYDFNPDLLFGAAVLHDIAKGRPRHETRGAEILNDLGLAEIAAIVAAHRDLHCPKGGGITEKEIVCFADKLISGSRRVRICQRYDEKQAAFSGDNEAFQVIERRRSNALALQDLFERELDRGIDDILDEAGL